MKKNSIPNNDIASPNWIEISEKEFYLLSSFVYEKLGINLTEQKKTLLMSRLQKLLRNKKISSFLQYYDYLIGDKSGEALSDLANYISTNHTFFYRENDHFDFFSNIVLPEIISRLKKTNGNDIRIWSAGCSTGEEPYTLVMLMLEYLGANYQIYDAGVLATDISQKALDTAKLGIYPEERINLCPEVYKKKYFEKREKNQWLLIDKVKKEVTFRRFNLMNEVFPFRKQFDCIFCRNVMIYFDTQTRESLVNKFYELTIPGGYLFIGHSESLPRDTCRYKFIKPAVYQKI